MLGRKWEVTSWDVAEMEGEGLGRCLRLNSDLSCGMGLVLGGWHRHSYEEKIQISSLPHLTAKSALFLIHSAYSSWANPL